MRQKYLHVPSFCRPWVGLGGRIDGRNPGSRGIDTCRAQT